MMNASCTVDRQAAMLQVISAGLLGTDVLVAGRSVSCVDTAG
jgi:hypothetical protein